MKQNEVTTLFVFFDDIVFIRMVVVLIRNDILTKLQSFCRRAYVPYVLVQLLLI